MANQYGPRIVTDGLVLHLDAGNSKSYPGSGTSWLDLSGNNNNGTLINGPIYNSINNRGSITFDGINDYVNIPNSISFGSISFTWSLFYKILSSGNAAGVVTAQVNDPFNTAGKGVQLRLRTYSNNAFEYALNDGIGTANRLIIPNNNLNIISNITIVHNYNSMLYVYKNSILSVSMDYSTEGNSLFSDTPDIWLCRGNNAYSNLEIYNFSVYNRALSATEVAQNYNALKGRFNL